MDIRYCFELLNTVNVAVMSVCLSVSNITQDVITGLRKNFIEGSLVVNGTSDKTLAVIWITPLTA